MRIIPGIRENADVHPQTPFLEWAAFVNRSTENRNMRTTLRVVEIVVVSRTLKPLDRHRDWLNGLTSLRYTIKPANCNKNLRHSPFYATPDTNMIGPGSAMSTSNWWMLCCLLLSPTNCGYNVLASTTRQLWKWSLIGCSATPTWDGHTAEFIP